MPSVRRNLTRLAIAACGGALLLGAGTGCETTQDKAAAHQAESERILEARAERQKERKAERRKQKTKAEAKKQKEGKQ